MKNVIKKKIRSKNRKWRIRKRIIGSFDRPRLSVRFTGKNIYAQCINDNAGETLVFISSYKKNIYDKPFKKFKPNLEGTINIAKKVALKIKKVNIKSCVFDRNGKKYHGKIKKFVELIRQSGIKI
jgi:large subunit ribosomal protein L18